jgi:hypothetical protein
MNFCRNYLRHLLTLIYVDKKCTNCGNNEQTDFIMDAKNGDIICQNCGAVVIESLMHEGSQFRKFEGERLGLLMLFSCPS